jgi:hypothetical protein
MPTSPSGGAPNFHKRGYVVRVMVILPLHLVWRNFHYLIREDQVIAVTFGLDNIPLPEFP